MTPEQLAASGTEHAHQRALFAWLARTAYTTGDERLHYAFAIPNGGLRDRITAAKLKAEGVKSGVPDIMLPVPCDGFTGLFIEMKRPGDGNRRKGAVSADQKQWAAFLREQGYRVETCFGWEEARNIICDYLGEKYP